MPLRRDAILPGSSVGAPSASDGLLIGLHTPSFESCRKGDNQAFRFDYRAPSVSEGFMTNQFLKGLILAQNERWRRGLGMQVEREPGSNTWGEWRKGQ